MSTFQGTVIDISFEGQGVIKHPDGRVFFAWGVWLGEVGTFEITKSDKKYGFARLKELKSSHPLRRSAPCRFHGFSHSDCSGCSWMFMDETEQRMQKRNILEKLIERNLRKSESLITHEIIFCNTSLGYRKRARVRTNGREIGFINRDAKALVSIDDCIVLTPEARKNLYAVRDQLSAEPISQIGFIDITETAPITSQLAKITDLLNYRSEFQQASDEVNHAMKLWLAQFFQRNQMSPTRVLELFCGSGNFTRLLASEFPDAEILALEGEKEAVESLKRNDLPRVSAATCDLFKPKERERSIHGAWLSSELLFLDPPRAGFPDLHQLIQSMDSPPLWMVYVSCDPASMVRDIAPLVGTTRGSLPIDFDLVEVQPFDAFSQTPHMETIAILKRRDDRNGAFDQQ